MAKITRTIKFWSEQNGQSHHYGVELDTEKDLNITIEPGEEADKIRAALTFADRLLMAYVAGAANKDD